MARAQYPDFGKIAEDKSEVGFRGSYLRRRRDSCRNPLETPRGRRCDDAGPKTESGPTGGALTASLIRKAGSFEGWARNYTGIGTNPPISRSPRSNALAASILLQCENDTAPVQFMHLVSN